MRGLHTAAVLLSDAIVSRLASNAAASSSTSSLQHTVRCASTSLSSGLRHFASGVDYSDSPSGANAGNTKVKSGDQPGDSVEAELTRVRAKRLTRAQRPSYLDNEDFEDEIKESSILVEPDVPVYDLREVLDKVGFPIQPDAPFFEDLKHFKLDSPELVSLGEEEEEPPFPGARSILHWEQRIVFSQGSFAGDHPVNRKAKCSVYLRDLQEQHGLTDNALQLIAQVCGKRYNANKGLLTLVSEKYDMREENRRHIMQMLVQLVEEGHKAFPAEESAPAAESQQQQQAAQ